MVTGGDYWSFQSTSSASMRPVSLAGSPTGAVSRAETAPRSTRSAGVCLAVAGGLVFAAVPSPATARTVVGGAGPDRLVSKSPGGDLLFGGGGADTLIGGPHDDTIYGARSGNTIDARGGDNYVEGGTGSDEITAGDGNNTIYGGSGHDTISAGDGNNYVDPGGAPDDVRLGHGDNVVSLGSGGAKLRAGNGNNTVYYSAGADEIDLGHGVNTVWMASIKGVGRVDCGGNPRSAIYVNGASDPDGRSIRYALSQGRVINCPIIGTFTGPRATKSRSGDMWAPFELIGDDGRDKLYGGHGGGLIDGKGGDNILWADWVENTGGKRARANTTTLLAGDGDNIVYGGRGTNLITVGNGRNFIRGGAWNNTINVGTGRNTIRLQGRGRNTVNIAGGTAYVESFTRGPRPVVNCLNGARGIVVHGVRRPKTNCRTVTNGSTKRGKKLQVRGLDPIPDSDPIVDAPLRPGSRAGVPRPNPVG